MMNTDRVKKLLNRKEDIRLEYKKATNDLPKNLFESICAMLNRDGGDILLGVDDNGIITGIDEACVDKMITNISNISNDPLKIEPPFILFPQKYKIDEKWIIHIQVPASSQVHKTVGVIFDRSNDGDFKIQQAHQIAELHNRKRNYYTENIIYPALRFEDFKESLFPKVRNLMRSFKPNHPWLALNDRDLLIKAGLWKQDYQTNREGYTLAAALLFGKDEVIQNIIPHYKIDAVVRIENITRYDDREYIQTNLIEAYETLMNFTAKHLPDKFYLEGGQRVSLRSKIFREIIANLIVHREYTNAYPCRFIIYSDRVETENASNPKYYGKINPNDFTPYPKNPTIAKFFLQLGIVEELGSGVLNVSNLAKEYSNGGDASFIEGDVFKMIIPLNAKAGDVNGGVNPKNGDVNRGISFEKIIGNQLDAFIKNSVNQGIITQPYSSVITSLVKIVNIIYVSENGISSKSIANEINRSVRTVEKHLKVLRDTNIIEFKGSPKTGRYYLTEDFQQKLS